MNKISVAACALVLSVSVLAWAKEPAIDPAKLPPPSTQQGVTFEKDIRPIFENSCFRCHGVEKQKEDLRVDSLEAVLKGGEHGKVVIPGDSAKSPLVIAISRLDADSAMPPSRKGSTAPPPTALTPEQVGLVRAWIDQGAK